MQSVYGLYVSMLGPAGRCESVGEGTRVLQYSEYQVPGAVRLSVRVVYSEYRSRRLELWASARTHVES